MGNSRFATVAETISALEHSNLPTVIVEGSDDIIIYRLIENNLEDVDVMPVSGRNAVLEIFRNKLTNPKLQNKKILFIADKDTWVNTGIPTEYKNDILIFTNGYSIENDVFIDFCCQQIIENNPDKKVKFENDKDKFIHWYALALQTKLNQKPHELIPEKRELATHPKHLLNDYQNFIQLLEKEVYPMALKNELNQEYELKIRGKSLLDLFTKTFKEHNSTAMFQALAVRPNHCINQPEFDIRKGKKKKSNMLK